MLRQFAAALFTLALAAPAMAGEVVPWDAARFSAAQAADQPILIHVTAPWCPTCHAQVPVVAGLAADPANPDLIVFDVDFDTEKDALRAFNVRNQSTLIAFQGTEERGRSVGVTDPGQIGAIVALTR